MRRAIMLATALGLIAPTVHAIEVEPDAFRPYAAGLIDRLALGTEGLARAIEVGDLGQARKAWIAARVGWERGETFLGEYFPEADETIDSWPDARSGFHALEPLLFKEDDLGAAKPMVERLREDVDALRPALTRRRSMPRGSSTASPASRSRSATPRSTVASRRSPRPRSRTCRTT